MKYKSKKQYRLSQYDYSLPGYYFVTICTKNMNNYFGDIRNSDMKLSSMGKIAKQIWVEIPAKFLEVNLDALVIMPNHIHGIIEIIQSNPGVETLHATSLRKFGTINLYDR